MCGIAGFINITARFSQFDPSKTLESMSNSLYTRGPDGGSMWIDNNQGVALGHRRLNILDLSQAASQPMISANGRFVISFNGEIYNFKEIAKELGDLHFKSNGDTEVLLEACARWGVEAAVNKCNGMFAFALWDRETKSLYLVRDRIGIKPLYWFQNGNHILFASQTKALVYHPFWQQIINPDSLALYLRFGNVPSPHSIFKNCHQVRPGHIIKFTDQGKIEEQQYWSIPNSVGNDNLDEAEALETLKNLLSNTVSQQMASDVPLGAFLSGGIDSSTITALMQAQSNRKINSYSIGFEDKNFDESHYAQRVAEHLGTNHTKLIVTKTDAINVVPTLSEHYDEPFADSSQIPTLLLAKLTRQNVTVALSGDGGDEVFSGYNRYLWAQKLDNLNQLTPRFLQILIAKSIKVISPTRWNYLYNLATRSKHPMLLGDKLHKLADSMPLGSLSQIYERLISFWPLETSEDDTIKCVKDMRCADILNYLPNDILTKVDRASMAHSLEVRVPLLDHHVVEFGLKLPEKLLIVNGQGKYLLRKLLYQYIPKELIERPKMGFGVPLAEWLRGPLKDWAADLLDAGDPLLDNESIQRHWEEHLLGSRNWASRLWTILMFQQWRREAYKETEKEIGKYRSKMATL